MKIDHWPVESNASPTQAEEKSFRRRMAVLNVCVEGMAQKITIMKMRFIASVFPPTNYVFVSETD